MSQTVQEFLAPYSPEVRDLALKVRALVLKSIPGAIEQIDPADQLIGYGFGLKMADIICIIKPLKSSVNLGLARGATLPDPEGLLEGAGKHSRHIKFKTSEAIEAPAVRSLLEAAVAAMKQR